LREDSQYVSSLEKQCQQKDTLISQLYNQLGMQQQQQQHLSDAGRLVYSSSDMSNVNAGQKLMQLEREVAAKRLEVEQLRAKVCLFEMT